MILKTGAGSFTAKMINNDAVEAVGTVTSHSLHPMGNYVYQEVHTTAVNIGGPTTHVQVHKENFLSSLGHLAGS